MSARQCSTCPVALLALLAAPSLQATTLSDIAAAVQPGQWVELPTANFNSATLDDGGAYSVFWYAEDIAWDAERGQLLFVGGGHGSDPEFLTYDEATNAWTRRKPGGGIPWDTYFSEAYDHIALVPALDRLYFRQPAFAQSDRIEIYDIPTATWSRSAPMPARPPCCGALEYFPELGGLVNVAGPGPVYFFDPNTGQWRTLAASVAIGDYHNFAEYSPAHGVLVFGGGEGANGRALYRMTADGSITRLADAPQRMGTTYSIVTTDPVSGNFLVFFDTASYELNPSTDVWTPLNEVPPWRPIGYPGVFAAVATPLSTYGVVLVAKYAGDDSRVYLYRHASATGPPPTLELAADPATVVRGDSTVLSWITTNASTCTASGGAAGWAGAKTVPNGSESIGPITAATTFGLTCSGSGGTVQRSVVVGVHPLPAVALAAEPSTVVLGAKSLLTWSAQNASACMALGAWSGSRPLSGSEYTEALSSDSTFSLECSGIGGTSERSVTVTVVLPPPPTLAALSPSAATAGSPAFLLSVSGANFVAGSVVRWNGEDRATTFVASDQLTAEISAADVALAGNASVSVWSPPPGGGASNVRTFVVTAPSGYPAPAISALAPGSATAGGGALTLTVDGTSFVAASIVRWNGSDRATTFVSATRLTAAIAAADIAAAGTAEITVFTPPPGGGLSNAQSFTVVPAPVSDLVAAYGFNAASGTTVADSSGNGNTGTVNGATWVASGRFGAALNFNGTSNTVLVADSPSLDLTTGMTLEAWVYPTAAPSGWRAIITKERPTAVAWYLHASSSSANRPATGVFVTFEGVLYGGSRLPANVWTHLAATYDGTTHRLFVNGSQVASRAQSGALQTTANPLRIGGNNFGEFFRGRIDEVRIYRRALTAAEIQTDMATPLP